MRLRQAAVRIVEKSPLIGTAPNLVAMLKDPDPLLRTGVLQCLICIGRDASNAGPAVLQLCRDKDLNVRTDAALALWRITGQTNSAVLVLEDVLGQNEDAHSRHCAAHYLV